jgi:hypothetical protein
MTDSFDTHNINDVKFTGNQYHDDIGKHVRLEVFTSGTGNILRQEHVSASNFVLIFFFLEAVLIPAKNRCSIVGNKVW